MRRCRCSSFLDAHNSHTKIDYAQRKKQRALHTRQPVCPYYIFYIHMPLVIRRTYNMITSAGIPAKANTRKAPAVRQSKRGLFGLYREHLVTHRARVLEAREKNAKCLTHDLARKMCITWARVAISCIVRIIKLSALEAQSSTSKRRRTRTCPFSVRTADLAK